MSKTINNLQEFLDWRGCGDNPYEWARAFYKYTDCGPWVRFLMRNAEGNTYSIYYEDRDTKLDPALCVGIKFGSIVEGSDVESGPFTHKFPFESDAFNKDVAHMEAETSFYWERDNASWYTVRTEDDEWTVSNSWGDIRWKGDPPPGTIKAAAEAAIKEDWQDDPEHSCIVIQTIPKLPGLWATAQKDWKAMPLGDTGAEIYTFENDTTFEDVELPDGMPPQPEKCPHGNAWGDCDACDEEGDRAYDSARERQ